MCLSDIAGPLPGSAKPSLAAPRQDSCPANKPHFVPVGKSGLSGKSLSRRLGPGLGTRKLNKTSSAGHDSWAQGPPPPRRGEDGSAQGLELQAIPLSPSSGSPCWKVSLTLLLLIPALPLTEKGEQSRKQVVLG